MNAEESAMLDEIVDRLRRKLDPEGIYLFGSRAWGEPNEDSDYDLFVIMPDGESDEPRHNRAVRVTRCLWGLSVPIDVIVKTRYDFDRFSRVPAALETKILQEGRLLYGGREDRAGAKLATQGRS